MYTQGGLSGPFGGHVVAIRPNDLRPLVDFSARVWLHWPMHMVFFISWPLDWSPGRVASKQVRAHDEPWESMLHGNVLRKIILKKWGTWESNPGPNTWRTTHQPAEPTRYLDIIVGRDYYEREQTLVVEHKNTREWFEFPSHVWTRPPSSSFAWN